MTNRFGKFVSAVVIMSMVFVTVPVRPAQAWIPGAESLIKQGLEEMSDAIKGIINAALKTTLMQAVTRQLDKAIGGSGTAIMDWQTFLFLGAATEAQKYGTNLIAEHTRGQGSSRSFQSEQPVLEGGVTPVERLAKGAAQQLDKPSIEKVTLGEVARLNNKGQVDVFDPNSPNFAGYFALYNASNNVGGFATKIVSETEREKEEVRTAKMMKQIGAGFDTKPGTNPGVVAAAKVESALVPLKRATHADNWQEMTAALVSGIATKALQSATDSAVKKAERTVTAKIKDVNKGVGKVFDKAF